MQDLFSHIHTAHECNLDSHPILVIAVLIYILVVDAWADELRQMFTCGIFPAVVCRFLIAAIGGKRLQGAGAWQAISSDVHELKFFIPLIASPEDSGCVPTGRGTKPCAIEPLNFKTWKRSLRKLALWEIFRKHAMRY